MINQFTNTLKLFSIVLLSWAAQAEEISFLEVEVVNTFAHDPAAFTQGLAIEDGFLYEGTGRYGESRLGKRTLDSTELLQRHNLSRRHFGEGITIHEDRIIQLTWQSNLGFVYDLATFDLLETFYLEGEGWGITSDGSSLIVSDGTASLRFLDPEDFQLQRRLEVRDDQGPVLNLNELEFIDGQIWANIWFSDHIIRIDPDTGKVTARVDLSGLFTGRTNRDQVLNGIAWDADSGRLFVTGKLWPRIFEIKLVE